MATKSVGDSDFDTAVLKSGKPVLVDFWAEWCAPCKAIAPSLEEISDELADKVVIAKLDVEEHLDAPSKYGIRNIPTMILFKDGVEVDRRVGGGRKAELKSWLEAAL